MILKSIIQLKKSGNVSIDYLDLKELLAKFALEGV
jgi:hypothetical protein